MWYNELAKEIKNRDNKMPETPLVGTVVSVSPLKISIFNNKVILNREKCYICQKVSNSLLAGDNVLCIPTQSGQKYFIVDKVV